MKDGYEQLSSLSPEQRQLLLLRLKKQKEGGAREEPAIARLSRDANEFPLSFAQQRIWFLEQFEKNSVEYNVAMAFSLAGQLRVSAFEDAVNDLVARHETLRTRFKPVDGQPVQVISPRLEIEVDKVDLTHLAGDEQAEKLRQLADEEASAPFDLSRGPLIRVTLLQLETERHVLFLTIHHIVFDGWSRSILYDELSALYDARVTGIAAGLPELDIQYVDFSVWQSRLLESETFRAQLDYWRQRLQGAPPEIGLPSDRPRGYLDKTRARAESFFIGPELTAGSKALASQAGTTLFTLLLSAYALLLSRYCGHPDIVIGFPVANRNHRELERLIGMFLNTIVVRADLAASPDFRQLLEQVGDEVRQGLGNQDVPFQKLVEALHPDRNLRYTPIFQVAFNLLPASSGGLSLKGLSVSSLKLWDTVPGTNYDLTFSLEAEDDGIRGLAEYNADLFDPATIKRMIGSYRTLLEGCLGNPQLPVDTLPILDPAEKHRILVEWNDTAADYDRDTCLHEWFERQVERSPESLAVAFRGEGLTYRQLNEQSNRLAHRLLEMGVGKEAIVGIFMDRSAAMIAAVLGVLKAGCAYLPMDPVYPRERLAFMQEDSGVAAILTEHKYRAEVPLEIDNILCLDSDREQLSRQGVHNPGRDVDPADLAYIIYTSGTTGKPKGVQVFHRPVVNLLNSLAEKLLFSERDVLFSVNALSFDIVILDFFLPLVSGASIVMSDPENLYDGRKLLAELQDSGASIMPATPATWKMLVDAGWEEKLPLRIFCGGEALPRKLADQLLDRCDVFWNAYGPTETTVCTSLTRLESKETPISIGKPIANTRMYVLDPKLQPVPVGVPGELHIGGECMSRGYRNRPQLTAERFIPDPFDDRPGSLLYKTGDLVRYLADGNIDFIRRVDNQVKVRGYRIELGEIEAVLSRHDSIRDCAVLIYEDAQGNANIAAFFVADGSLSTLSLRNYLRKKLPHYMIPGLLTQLDEIPVAPNGKTDFRLLSSYTRGTTIRDSSYVPAETPMEKTIAGIWERLLDIDRAGVGDNFFDIGGHSLLIIQAISVIEKAVGVSVPVKDFFYQNLGQIAAYCEKHRPPDRDGEAG